MDFVGYLSSLAADWVALRSGAVGLGLTVIGFFRDPKEHKRLFWFAGLMCLLVASARIWTTEHRRAEDSSKKLEDQANPHFTCNIDTSSIGYNAHDSTHTAVIKMIVSIRNTGAQSTAEGYSILVLFSDGSSHNAIQNSIPEGYTSTYPNR